VKRGGVESEPLDPQMRTVDVLRSKTAYLDIDDLSELTAQVVHVNTCAPINVWGVLVRQKQGLHRSIKKRSAAEGKPGGSRHSPFTVHRSATQGVVKPAIMLVICYVQRLDPCNPGRPRFFGRLPVNGER
jgi:hypothetical protein